MVLNSLLLLLWSVAFALLSWWSAGTLRHVCNKDNWDTTTGITVCREYKALFSFSLFGFVSTLLALVLDVHTMRGATRRGKFTQLRMEMKRGLEDEHMPELARGGEEFNPNPKAGRKQRPRGGDGYGVLEAEYVYDDTVYHGAGGQVGRRSLEERV
ncbi:hypothetical protein BS50DRAFT_567884 [Corynespora cassiicola Philippines]|uniref:MARVEL domain-containing protein n=1 Tax=Corynespora cassiicola Philippines TaxID=1448308 RepID=A0A2T2PCS1_CORCC|nr:hypothetical protein BS50DRAFT_567884 [Corynespora cassiicola Philippines]